MSRVFLMKWYHFSVEYFEDLRNINHCEFLIMNKQENGKYVLENKLRTWSELRRERALKKEKDKEKVTPTSRDTSKLDKALTASQSPIVAPRRWGGCPDGCNHDKSFRIRSTLADLVKSDASSAHTSLGSGGSPVSAHPLSAASISSSGIATTPTTNGLLTPSSGLSVRRHQARRFQSEDEEDLCCSSNEAEPKLRTPQIDVIKAREETVSSPDGTPSFISVDDRLRAQDQISPPAHRLHARGRDFGGSYSGQNSRANSDADSSEDERTRLARRHQLSSSGLTELVPASTSLTVVAVTSPEAGLRVVTTSKSDKIRLDKDDGVVVNGLSKRHHSTMGRGIMANRLGDSPVSSSSNDEHEHADDERERAGLQDDADDLSDIDTAERVDRSIKGSVY